MNFCIEILNLTIYISKYTDIKIHYKIIIVFFNKV